MPKAPAAKAPVKAAPAKPGKAVATQKAAPVTKATGNGLENLDDDFLSELADESGSGLEKASRTDYALPFVYLLQKNSPQVEEGHAKYVEGAKAGMFINSVTQELYPDGIRVIPCDFEKTYIEWVKREDGGGFVSAYRTRAEGEANMDEEHQLVDTANHYVLVESEGGEWTPAIVSMTSTKLKASRKWMSIMSMVTVPTANGRKVAPTYARMYEIVKEGPIQNAKGSFYTVKVNPIEGEDGWVKDAAVRNQAKDFRSALEAGSRGADYNTVDAVVVDEEDDAAQASM